MCPARQELLETRPKWTRDRPAAVEVRLTRLSDADSERVVTNLLGTTGVPEEVQERIAKTGEGDCSSSRSDSPHGPPTPHLGANADTSLTKASASPSMP